MPAERGPSGTGHDTPPEYDLTLNERIVGTYDTPERAEEAKRWYVKTYGPLAGTFKIEERTAPDPPAAVPGPASVSPAEQPRHRITATHTRSLTFVQAEVDAVWNSGILPIPHVEHVRADDPDARAIALFEALDGSSLELFWDEANDDVGYEITEDDPDA